MTTKKPDPADDGPEVDIIAFFTLYPSGAKVWAPTSKNPIEFSNTLGYIDMIFEPHKIFVKSGPAHMIDRILGFLFPPTVCQIADSRDEADSLIERFAFRSGPSPGTRAKRI